MSDGKPSAKVILDSISPDGSRLTTLECVFHRFVLSEWNTHRSLSRNSASSRAIPVEKQLQKLIDNPAWPIFWASEQPGMQGGGELEGQDLEDAQNLFEGVYDFTVQSVKRYLDAHPDKSNRLHKSLINRLLEPFMWHTVIATATEAGWENFFKLRSRYYTLLAQPEIAEVADLAYDAYQDSIPRLVPYGSWHTPYIREEDEFLRFENPLHAKLLTSVGRCARVSYLTHEGRRDVDEDIALATKLVAAVPKHDSPFEHVAFPQNADDDLFTPCLGNFDGWHQLRHAGERLGVIGHE